LVALLTGGWVVGSWLGPRAFRLNEERRLASLEVGAVLPEVGLREASGRIHQLSESIHARNVTHVVMLSSTCSSCIGELDAWNQTDVRNRDVQILVLVYSNRSGYMEYVNGLVKPSVPVFEISALHLKTLRAFRTPLVYGLGPDRRVLSVALGVEAAARARTLLEPAMSRSSQ